MLNPLTRSVFEKTQKETVLKKDAMQYLVNEIGLASFDDKEYVLSDGVRTLASAAIMKSSRVMQAG